MTSGSLPWLQAVLCCPPIRSHHLSQYLENNCRLFFLCHLGSSYPPSLSLSPLTSSPHIHTLPLTNLRGHNLTLNINHPETKLPLIKQTEKLRYIPNPYLLLTTLLLATRTQQLARRGPPQMYCLTWKLPSLCNRRDS